MVPAALGCATWRSPVTPLAVSASKAAGPSPQIVSLPGSFPSRYVVPVLRSVNVAIFGRRYFTHCMQCSFCHDWCCSEGVDVDLLHLRALEAHAEELEAHTGISRQGWFLEDRTLDPEMPGGGSVR